MALVKLLSKRLSGGLRVTTPAVSLQHSPISSPAAPSNAAKSDFSSEREFSRQLVHQRAINKLPECQSMPVGERLRSIAGGRIILFDGVAEVSEARDRNLIGVPAGDERKILRLSQMEKLKLKLKQIHESSIQYREFVRICVEECGREDEGIEVAKALDQCGNVIVLGNIVILRPEQVAKSIESIIFNSTVSPNDPRRKQLKELEQQKALIDQKAQAQVRAEMYCGLGLLAAQTLGFMRLTFWELSWDVMEPICFFLTSFHFALAYIFFMRTSTEPSFQGYFQRRFRTKQKKLMKIHSFDIVKYIELRKIFYPNMEYYGFPYKSINGV